MPTIEIKDPRPGLEARFGEAQYGVFDHGAQVFAWRPPDAQPVIWMSRRSQFASGRAIRGGVPVCFPWFGGGPQGALQPPHGFARLLDWRRIGVNDETESQQRLSVDYALDSTMVGAQPAFPHRFAARLTAVFARDFLQIDLEVKNGGASDFVFEAALHTYLAVGDARRLVIEGLEGARFLDKAAEAPARERVQEGPLALTGETDRVYDSQAAVTVTDPIWERRLVVTKGGSAQTVIWNPWETRARAMADFGDEEWTGMVCVEAANALHRAVRVAPGASHRLWQRVALA